MKKAFTLIELMIVVAIIGTLTTGALTTEANALSTGTVQNISISVNG